MSEKRRNDFEQNREQHDARIAALPEPMRVRIERFQRARPDWRPQFEAYELFVCEQAALFAEKLGDQEAISDFYSKRFDEQKQQIPEMSNEHSGNTFGASCLFATMLVQKDFDNIIRMHGALCHLVGCKNYGCWTTENASERDQI